MNRTPVASGARIAQSSPRFWRTRVILFVALCGIGICGWLVREPLLQSAASLWIISDPLTRADAIVVLGGNFHVRPLMAVDLYRRGFADKILISQTTDSEQSALAGHGTDAELNRGALLKYGVPDSAIEEFGSGNSSTGDEAIALREWAQQNGASVFIIPSEMLSARRVQWIFRRELSDIGIKVEVLSFEPPGYPEREWWKTEKGLLAFRDEVVKYVYYRFRY